jgi:LacI family transcriptional regulator
MPISILDVARRAGVSAGTVSHVMNGSTRVHIAATTKDRVRRAAVDLGYVPNRLARGLCSRKTETIGLFLPSLQNPFYVDLLELIELSAFECGYYVLLDAKRDLPTRSNLRGWPIDGVLIWAGDDALCSLEQILQSQADQLPLVHLGGQPRSDHTNVVHFDVYSGVRQALFFLLNQGHSRIAYLYAGTWVEKPPIEVRRQAYTDVCREAGIPLQMMRMREQFETRQAGLTAGLDIAAMPVDTRPTAVLCFNDVIAEGVLFGLRRAGLRVPQDLAIVGVDGLDTVQYLDTPITTVVLPRDEMCRAAVSLLIEQINGTNGSAFRQIAIPTHLRIGATT